jgi:long-chain acyl-CoA synthetase
LLRGSVGKPLPGVEVKIESPDENGVGEVLARGQNVMLGYYNNEEATEAVLQDRWLRTGDLGKSTKTEICISSDARKTSLLIRTAKIFTRTKSKILRKIAVHQRIVGRRFARRGRRRENRALVVPDYEYDIALSRAKTTKKVEEHFREVSAGLPFSNASKFCISRRLSCRARRRAKSNARKSSKCCNAGSEIAKKNRRFRRIKRRRHGFVDSQNRRVGFQSRFRKSRSNESSPIWVLIQLMFVELQAAVEDAGGRVVSPDTLNEVQTVRELLTAVQRVDKSKKIVDEPKAEEKKGRRDFHSFDRPPRRQSSRRFRAGTLYETVLKHENRRRSERPAAHEFHRRAQITLRISIWAWSKKRSAKTWRNKPSPSRPPITGSTRNTNARI